MRAVLHWFSRPARGLRLLLSFVLLCVLCIAAARAATPQTPETRLMIEALSRASSAVVGVKVTAIEDARSVETLGRRRHGSGVVISPDGLILTIGYLLLEADHIEIITQDNRILPARAVAYDLATGFGLLQPLLPLREVSVVPLGNSQTLQAGEALLAMTGPGAQGGQDGDAEISMTRLVSRRAFSGSWEYHLDSALFTSPPVLAGGGNHSGAPLFNQKGELMGIGSLLVADASGESRRLPGNMFVPVDLLAPILAELRQTGSSLKSHRPWLGLTSQVEDGHVQILRVSKDSPADLAGLAAGDVVLEVDGAPVATLEAFYKKLWDRSAPDAQIRLTVRQGEDTRTLTLQAEDRLLTLKKPSTI